MRERSAARYSFICRRRLRSTAMWFCRWLSASTGLLRAALATVPLRRRGLLLVTAGWYTGRRADDVANVVDGTGPTQLLVAAPPPPPAQAPPCGGGVTTGGSSPSSCTTTPLSMIPSDSPAEAATP